MNNLGSTYWVFLALIIGMTVWMFWQQSQQRKKKQKEQASIRRGDRIYTSGGLIGTVRDLKDDRITLDVAEGVRVELLRSAIEGRYQPAQSAPKATADKPAKGDKPTKKSST